MEKKIIQSSLTDCNTRFIKLISNYGFIQKSLVLISLILNSECIRLEPSVFDTSKSVIALVTQIGLTAGRMTRTCSIIGSGSTKATRVYGQAGSFTTGTANNGGISADSLNAPAVVTVDSGGNLYVAEASNNRVLFFPSGSTAATRVYGQNGNFSANTADNGGISANSLNLPQGLAVDSIGNLYITETSNSRILYYPSGSTTATKVYGQNGSFSSNTANNGGISANSLNNPVAIALDAGGNLYAADSQNNRILYYPSGSTTATKVYGQPDFFSSTINNGGISAASLNNPLGVAVDSVGNLYIGDMDNNRALYYPSGNAAATRVYGQPDFFSSTGNNGGLSADSLRKPARVAVDCAGNLFVTDQTNNRVLYYSSGSTTA
ncbi:MAG TPA: hypothetical protein PLJ29_02165, partial [Leptospiraceae bacterium]|nr:hypothetical protein [Leptospiraceae bacterium]